MNFIKKFWGAESAPETELASIPGALNLVRGPNSPKSSFECIYPDAELSLMEADGGHRLVAHQVFEEGAVFDDEDPELCELENQRLFLVDEFLKIAYSARDSATVISWRDPDGDDEDRFEFVCEKNVPAGILDMFDITARRAQYERKYGKPPASNADLEEFNFDEVIDTGVPLHASEERKDKEEQKGSEKQVVHPFTDGKSLVEKECTLYFYDASTNTFVIQESNVKVVLLETDKFEFWIEVRSHDSAILGVDLRDAVTPVFSHESVSFIFNLLLENKTAVSYLIRFAEEEDLAAFEQAYNIATWEFQNKASWKTLSEVDHNYLLKTMRSEDVVMFDDDDHCSEEDFEEVDEEDDDELEVLTEWRGDKQTHNFYRNSQLEVGNVINRSYVVRGDKVGVFKNGDDMEYYTTISNMEAPDGTKLVPSSVMLHEEDRAMILQDRDNPEKLFHMDIEYGKVDEWDLCRPVVDFAPVSKHAQTTNEKTLFGVASRNMFRMDPRLSGSKVVADEEKQLTSVSPFTTIATTEHGYVAVGSVNGEIRLVDKIGKRTKTTLPSMGDKILGLTVSANGRWVLATFKTYLLLIEVANETNNGYTHSWPKDSKPKPRRLQISPENTAYMFQNTREPISFTPAHFNSGFGVEEQSIVTSTGPYVVTWSLPKVLKNDPSPYLIKRYDSNVTANNFMFGTDKRLIVTLADDVGMLSKSALREPNRDTLLDLPSTKRKS
ncbi:Vacuolar import and degradation protein 27 [Wickerhamiella sorbophila]|uniref:Vacuolar import and degradation protein 27 n=1 Tax=Wickerhamiella sorbophila TaxID=45607 RepID=A0A2T0FMS9_9ASCO|nr:Vacuolar import and degradation protein 27 [Wickerhamiella sorbophila]PRT56269.1 Vacuolar import and degradation protein 27 [Wickerhamiella sorbophila]